MSKTYVIISWYFNPVHPGHIEYFELSKAQGDELWVVINNDTQAELKRGIPSFQDNDYRMRVVGAMKSVDQVVLSIDDYQLSWWEIPVIKSLEKVAKLIRAQDPDARLIFANWWDRNKDLWNIPEAEVCREYNIELLDGMWEKTHSSRDYIVLDED